VIIALGVSWTLTGEDRVKSCW